MINCFQFSGRAVSDNISKYLMGNSLIEFKLCFLTRITRLSQLQVTKIFIVYCGNVKYQIGISSIDLSIYMSNENLKLCDMTWLTYRKVQTDD